MVSAGVVPPCRHPGPRPPRQRKRKGAYIGRCAPSLILRPVMLKLWHRSLSHVRLARGKHLTDSIFGALSELGNSYYADAKLCAARRILINCSRQRSSRCEQKCEEDRAGQPSLSKIDELWSAELQEISKMRLESIISSAPFRSSLKSPSWLIWRGKQSHHVQGPASQFSIAAVKFVMSASSRAVDKLNYPVSLSSEMDKKL